MMVWMSKTHLGIGTIPVRHWLACSANPNARSQYFIISLVATVFIFYVLFIRCATPRL